MNNADYWFPWFPAIFQANTLELTLEQDAIYRRLIDHYMITREPLPESFGALARIAGCPIDIIEQNATAILDAYFSHSNGMYFHGKCNEILEDQDKRQKKKTAAGKKAAKKRWSQSTENKEQNATAIVTASQSHSKPIATAMQQDIDIDKDSKSIVSKDTPDFIKFIDAYNAMAERASLSKCTKLTAPRKSKLKARIKDCGGWNGWIAALEKVENSEFLCGSTGWKANFDFILQESSFTKIIEGNYDGKQHKNSTYTPEDAMHEALAELEQEQIDHGNADRSVQHAGHFRIETGTAQNENEGDGD